MESSLRNRVVGVALASFVALGMTGCGMGKKVVSNVKVENQVIGNDLYVNLDATLTSGALYLPNVKLPLYNPKNPSQVLGEIETNGLKITARVNATAALKLPDLADGTKLPGGTAIPLALPQGLAPIGIPVFNSNSMVYLAVSGQQIMVGVAISIVKEDRLKLPLNIFLPFSISSEISGTAGFFLGEKQGVAVFALREGKAAAATIMAAAPAAASDASFKSLRSASGTRMNSAVAEAGRIGIHEEAISGSKVRRLENTWYNLEDVRID